MAFWKVAAVLSFLCMAHAMDMMYDFETMDTMAPFSVDPECDPVNSICGPISSTSDSFIGGKRFIFLGTGSGVVAMDATDPKDLSIVDSVSLCAGSRSVVASQAVNGEITVWTSSQSEFCSCVSPPCHKFSVEINGELYDAAEGLLSQPLTDTPLAGEVAIASPLQACEPLDNPSEVEGKIVLIQRGSCLFADKLQHALDAGAIGVIVGNNQYNDPYTSTIAMSGEYVDIPAVMISKPDFEEVMTLAEQQTITAQMGAAIGSDVTDPRFTDYQGVTKLTFDGESFSDPEFFPDIMEPEVFGPPSVYVDEYHTNWLFATVDASNTYILDISSGSPVVAGFLNDSLPYYTIDVGGSIYTVGGFNEVSDFAVWEGETLEGLTDAEPYVTEVRAFNRPLWVFSLSYDEESIYFMPDTGFGGGIAIVDTTYFPDFYPVRSFWVPNAIPETTACDLAVISPSKDLLAVSCTAEGISFYDVTDRFNPEFVGGFDTYENKEADHTVYNWMFAYSDDEWLIIPSHTEMMSVKLVESSEDTCEPCECEVCDCDSDDDDGPETVINFNFEGMIPENY